ncbi:MAG: sulfate ABC transporter permease subunit CysT [Lysobacterales bacterium]|nr:sulfate ABC transporter permease subunit CysT [Xanthomonadales bacterium]MCB1613633.1 sulfate ABC transporter permease subunit CysT [Xanthomonadales bacterium]MCP5475016.1 sulfate ABC transporter permease subunit CysT [Rhodanobacteraceae bacterium]
MDTPSATLPPLSSRRVIPGFGLSLGITLSYLGLVVLLPLTALMMSALDIPADRLWSLASDPRTLAAFRLSFGLALLAAAINWLLGLLIAWVLVRYRFPGRALVDAAIDLPFALPTAVAGIALATVYAPSGWIGHWLAQVGIQMAFNPAGILLALIFVGLPFVVRTVQPVMRDLPIEREEAAISLGAGRWTVFRRVLLPAILPASITGMTLAFARAIGEYGSVIFIAGNLPMVSEIVPLLIVVRLEQFDFAGANALALMMLLSSLLLLMAINTLQRRYSGSAAHG